MPRLPLTAHRLAIAASAAVSFALMSCSESPSSPSREIAPGAPSLSQSQELADENGRHVFHTKQWHENDNANNGNGQNNGNAKGKPGGGGTSTGISYHGGPVLLSQTNVVAVYWAANTIFNGGPAAGSTGDGTTDGSLVGHFLRNLGSSDYFKINTTYTDGGVNHIASVVNYLGYWANNTSAPTGTQNVSDAMMLSMLQSGFATGKLTYSPTTLYAIFTSGQVNLGGGFGTQYCAYHFHGSVSVGGVTKTVLYAAMPYNNAIPSACTNGTAPANGDAGADYEVNTLGHEIEETTTDYMGTAWFDNRGFENADKCAWNFGTTTKTASGGVYNIMVGGKPFLVQQNWVNLGSGGCAQHL